MTRDRPQPRDRPRMLLPLLAVLALAASAAVGYAFLACGDFEAACAEQEQRVRIAAATRVRATRPTRTARAASGALFAAPRDQSDVRAMVEFCDTANGAGAAALREVALTAQDPLAAANAVRALGRLHAVTKDADLMKLLDDPRERVRDETILAVGESRDSSMHERLEPLTRSADEHVRVLAIRAVGRIGGERARRILEDVAAEPAGTPAIVAFARAGLAASGR